MTAKETVRRRDMALASDSHEYIILSFLFEWIRLVAAPAASGKLLDYGCGGQPYRALFSRYVTQYLGADIASADGVKLDVVVRPGEALDLPDHTIDTILSTQVLEHVADPRFYLKECLRLLRSGGRLLITVPMQWRHHEAPRDYLRFTRFGISLLLGELGFVIEDLRPCGGALALIGQVLINFLANRGVRRKWVFRCLNKFFLGLDRRFPDYEDTLNWMCIAHAPT